MKIQKISTQALLALKDALANVYWRKKKLRQFIELTMDNPYIVSTIDWQENPKYESVSQLIDRMAARQEMYQNDLLKLLQETSNTELLDILEHQENYQPLAIEAAKKEFEHRKLSDEEISNAKHPLILKQKEQEERKKKIKAIENKVKSTSNTLVYTLNPIQRETPTTDKLIKLISIAFFAFFLFKIINGFRIFSGMLNDISRFDSRSFFYFLPLVTLPIASIAFWMKKTFGWMLTAFLIIYSAIGAIAFLIESFNWKSTGTSFHNLFPRPSPIVFIVQIIFLNGVLLFISKPNIREIFKINRQRLIATIFMSSLVTIF